MTVKEQEKNKLQIINLLKQKNTNLEKFFQITHEAVFTRSVEDAETYSDLMSEREKLLVQMKKDDEALENYNYKNLLKSDDIEIKELTDKIRKNCKKIIDTDTEIKRIVEPTFFDIKSKLKEISQGKNLNSAYKNYSALAEGFAFDKKN